MGESGNTSIRLPVDPLKIEESALLRHLFLDFDPDDAEQGVLEILWPGMWRDKSVDGPSKCLNSYGELKKTVRRYVAALNVFFAPTGLSVQLRKHVEGCVGYNLRNRVNKMDLSLLLCSEPPKVCGSDDDKLSFGFAT